MQFWEKLLPGGKTYIIGGAAIAIGLFILKQHPDQSTVATQFILGGLAAWGLKAGQSTAGAK